MVVNLNDFLSNSYYLIDEALNTKMDLSLMRSDEHLQAVDRLLQLWEKYYL